MTVMRRAVVGVVLVGLCALGACNSQNRYVDRNYDGKTEPEATVAQPENYGQSPTGKPTPEDGTPGETVGQPPRSQREAQTGTDLRQP